MNFFKKIDSKSMILGIILAIGLSVLPVVSGFVLPILVRTRDKINEVVGVN